MWIPTETLCAGAQSHGILLTEEQLTSFDVYARMLVEWNEKMNLTAITEPADIAVKHFLDSLLLLDAVKPAQGASLIDVGTGAGFPAVPCAVVRPDLHVTLLDSLGKRVRFLTELCAALSVPAQAIHARAEEGGRNPQLREGFDVATARAVAHLRELSEYCLPFVKTGGVFAALKGPEIEAELGEAKAAVRLLGGKIEAVKQYALPGGNHRSIVVIRKISQTLAKFPRPSAKIAKEPLV